MMGKFKSIYIVLTLLFFKYLTVLFLSSRTARTKWKECDFYILATRGRYTTELPIYYPKILCVLYV